MIDTSIVKRPQTLCEVATYSHSLQEFGMNLRDWQHEIQRGGVHSSLELSRRLEKAPPILADQFPEGIIADAYLAAYAEWLADRAGIARPTWSKNPQRIAQKSWFATAIRGQLLVATPASFRQRNLFTVPEPIFHPRPGRPRVSEKKKRKKAQLRQKAYRARIRAIVEKARAKGL